MQLIFVCFLPLSFSIFALKTLQCIFLMKVVEICHWKLTFLMFPGRYDREEGGTIFDVDSTLVFPGDEASFEKKETELSKRLVSSFLFSVITHICCMECIN